MPWNGSGTFTPDPAGYPAVGGTTILASFYNAMLVDVTTVGFGNCITRDGQGKPSAAIDWNTQNLSNVGAFSLAGGITVTGLAKRFSADFSNATLSNRFAFQTSTTNGSTTVSVLPNGSGPAAAFNAYNTNDPANASTVSFFVNATLGAISSNAAGTGTVLPIAFFVGGTEAVRIDTSRRLLVGGTSNIGTSGSLLQVIQSASAGIAIATQTAITSGGSLTALEGWATHDGATYAVGAAINYRAAETWGAAAHGTDIQFRAVRSGTTTLTEVARMTSGGSLGISTATPNYAGYGAAVTVESSGLPLFELASTQADGSGVIVGGLEANFRTNSASHQRIAGIQFVTEGATANQRGGIFRFITKPNGSTTFAEVMRLDSSGRLAIGTATPTYDFEVARPGTTSVNAQFYNGTVQLLVNVGAGSAAIRTQTNHALTLGVNAGSNVIINTNGDIDARGVSLTRSKSADTNRNTTTVLADDPDLSVALAANTNYCLEVFAIFLGTTAAGMGAKAQFNYTGTFAGSGIATEISSVAFTYGGAVNAQSTAANVSLTTGSIFQQVLGLRTVNAGTLTLQWAQNSSNANNLSVKAGSFIRVTKLST